MKGCFRVMYLFVPIVIFLLVSTGCGPKHQHCVSWSDRQRSVPYCCKYGNGYCESTCYRTEYYKECTQWVCDEGYERDEDNKCVPIKYDELGY